MELKAPKGLVVAAEKATRDELGSVWVEDLYFSVNGDYYTIAYRPVSVYYYSGAVSMFKEFEEDGEGTCLVVENGEFITHVLLDARGNVWQIMTLKNAPRDWKPTIK